MRLSADQFDAIAALHDEGKTVREIAKATGIHRSSVHRALMVLDSLASGAGVSDDTPDGDGTAGLVDEVDPDPASALWCPAADAGTVWAAHPVADSSGRVSAVLLRPVRLWGRVVLVDAKGLVFCDDCRRLFDVAWLGSTSSRGHRASVWPPYGSGELRPLSDDDEWAPEPRWAW